MAIIREITFGDGTVVRITDWGKWLSGSCPLARRRAMLNRVNEGDFGCALAA